MGNSGGYSMATAVFAGALVLALLAGLLIGPGAGLVVIAAALLGTFILFARAEQSAAPGQTSAMFQATGGAAAAPAAPPQPAAPPAEQPTPSSAADEPEAHPS